MTDEQYLIKAKQIVQKFNFGKYIDSLLDYWEINPTTLGHGFDHVIKAGVECFEIARLNKYKNPEELFIAGLLHDIYRPSEGKAGMEKHHEQTIRLLNKKFQGDKFVQKLIKAIERQEKWRGNNPDKLDKYDLYLFVGERATHKIYMTSSYMWASNKYCKDHDLPLIYKNHQSGLFDFMKYQIPIWEIFIKFPIKGSNKAIDTYLEVYTTTASNYQKDRTGKNCLAFLDMQADICRKKEIEFLKFFGRGKESIKKIMRRMY